MAKTGAGDRRPLSWRKEALGLGIAAIVLLVVFWNGTLDIVFSSLFFDAEGIWPHAEATLWSVLYESDMYLTAILAAVAVVFIVVGIRRAGARPFVRYGIFIILTAAIGAGLLVNGILKEHWGRPRPDEIVEFGGNREYVQPWRKAPRGNGESFPSGHASIAFSYLAFWFIFRPRRDRLATACLWAAVFLGSLLGLGRIVQGRHFLSDVLWAAFIPYAVCLACFHLILQRKPAKTG